MTLQECIEFMQAEIDLAYSDGLPATAAGYQAVLEYLYMVEPNK
jgi:hypothetical protein